MTSGKKILLVDDDAVMQRVLQLWLRKAGFDCVLAEDGQVAANLLHAGQFDAVLVDLMMPIMDGFRFLKWARQEARISTPILVLSAAANAQVRQDVEAAGANAVLSKPVQSRALLEALTRILE